jgi:hypothetical protein
VADGIPGRVELLRGYGNGIVPQVAARFIEAFKDLIDEKGFNYQEEVRTSKFGER